MKIKELLFLFFLFLTPNSDAMNNATTDDKNVVPDSDDELSFYCVEWPTSYDTDDLLEAFMVYITGLEPIAKARALSKLKIFMMGLEVNSLTSIPESDESQFNLPLSPLVHNPPQSLRFDN